MNKKERIEELKIKYNNLPDNIKEERLRLRDKAVKYENGGKILLMLSLISGFFGVVTMNVYKISVYLSFLPFTVLYISGSYYLLKWRFIKKEWKKILKNNNIEDIDLYEYADEVL